MPVAVGMKLLLLTISVGWWDVVPEALAEPAAGARTLKCVCVTRQGDHGPGERGTCLTLRRLCVAHQEDASAPAALHDPRSEVTQASLPSPHG